MAERYATVLYCDDIRHEQGNKLSLIGIYTNDMFLESFPATLPKFAIVVTVFSPRSQPLEKVKVDILVGQEELATSEASGEALDKALFESKQTPSDPNAWVVLRAIFEFTNVNFEGPCKIRPRVTTEAGVIEGVQPLNVNLRPAAVSSEPA